LWLKTQMSPIFLWQNLDPNLWLDFVSHSV
jgi:hypothetical protein